MTVETGSARDLFVHPLETPVCYRARTITANNVMTALFTLQPEAVGTIRADSKPAILDRLASRFADVYGLDAKIVRARIEEREQLGSTGFGRGVAIPHARLGGLNRPVAAFLRLEAPVVFDAADGMPVDLVFGLLSPERAGAAHLHALAAISRMMRDDRMHASLVEAPGAEALYGLLCNVIDRDAA
jgi:nitrogen PTS system EIIA component